MKENSLVLYSIRSSAILLRWVKHNEAQNKNSTEETTKTLRKHNYYSYVLVKLTEIYIPTKSLWPVASMLFRLMPLKSNSADPHEEKWNSFSFYRGSLHRNTQSSHVFDRTVILGIFSLTFAQQFPVDVKWRPCDRTTENKNVVY